MPSERYRVRVARPRPGRDRGCWGLRTYGPGIARAGRRELTDIPHGEETREDAEDAARAREAQLNAEGLTLAEIVRRWLKAREGELAPSTIENHRLVLTFLRRTEFGALSDPLRGSQVLAYRDRLKAKHKTSVVRLQYGVAKCAWAWARSRDLVSSEWPSVPRLRTPRSERGQKRAFSDQEVADLLRHLGAYREGHYLSLAWALAETAARIRELLVLEVQDVMRNPDGTASLLIGRRVLTKTGEPRVSTVSPALAARLDLGRDPTLPLFPSQPDPERPCPYGTFRNVVANWLWSVGLYGRRDIHSFRRRGAVELHRAGIPVEVAKRITGHRDSGVFLSYADKGEYSLEAERRLLWVTPDLRGAS